MIVTATTLNVRSGPGPEFRALKQLQNGASVEVLETHGDWAWVDPAGGWVSRAYLATPRMAAPWGLAGILSTFGDPGSPAASAGRVVFPAPVKAGWENASITRATCHAKLEEVFTEVFREIYRKDLWHLIRTFDGIFNDRTVTSSQKKSAHAWGIAVDLNAKTNQLGARGDMSPRIVSIFEEHDFEWGGRWKRPDAMHFQLVHGY